MKDKVRLDYADKLKGLAILLVVAGHVTEYSFGIRGTLFNRFYGNIHVPLFFFISGYFAINNGEKEFFYFLKKKVEQLIFPTIIWGGIWFVFLGKNKDCYWFLPTLFYCQLVTRAIQSKLKKVNHVFAAGLVVLFLLEVCYQLNIIVVPLQLNFIHCYLFFLWGLLYHYHEDTLSKNIVYTISLIAFLGIMAIDHPLLNGFKVAGYFSCVILFELFKRYSGKYPHFLSIMGKHSMEIYVTHYLFLPNFIRKEKIEFVENPNVFSMDNLLPVATAAIIMAWLLCFICVVISEIIKESNLLEFICYGKRKEK